MQLENLGTEGKQTYVQVPTLALSSCMHLDKCLRFSVPQFFQLLDRNDNSCPLIVRIRDDVGTC